MKKQDYFGYLRNQCMSIPDLCEEQIKGVYKGLENTIPKDVIKDIRKVVVTGCGDSYLAAMASIPAFRKYCSRFGMDFSFERNIDSARYMKIKKENAPYTLIIGISASGSSSRVQEVLLRGNHHGCKTLALTNNADSISGKAAQYVLVVNTPPFENASPGLRSYFASLVGLFMFAAYMGEVKGLSPEGSLDKFVDAIREYTASYAVILEKMDDEMFEIAKEWYTHKGYFTIGDDVDFASAYFVAAKVVECSGHMCSTADSESWCHVQTFAHDQSKIGTIFVAEKEKNNRSRIGETIYQAYHMGFPVLLTSNGTKEDFGVSSDMDIKEFTLPSTPEGFEFLYPLLNYMPGSILSSYIAALNETPYFRTEPGSPHQKEGATNKTRSSDIVIV